MIISKPRKLWRHKVSTDRFFNVFNGEVVDGKYRMEDTTKFKVTEISVDDLVTGETYINLVGHCLKYVGDDNGSKIFEFISRSPLKVFSGENILGIHGKQWHLFWTLIKNDDKTWNIV